MAIQYEIKKHCFAHPSNVLSGTYGAEHMFSIKLDTDTDNGNLVAAGDWVSRDLFEEAAVTKFEGKIVEKTNNGYLVLVTEPGDALFVYENPIIAEDYTNNFKKLSNFYNQAGATVRAYGLHKYDRFEVSSEGFSGTPTVGATISGVTAKKMVVA